MTAKRNDNAQAGSVSRARDETDQVGTDTGRFGRRRFLRVSGVVIAGSFAGCLGGANEGSDDDTDSGPSSVDEWLADTDNYDSIEDTGEHAVTVEVGADGNEGANAFAPAAISITPGTTVTWTWVDGYHNVVDANERFDSGEPEQNATFEHTFDTAGTAYYYCKPHESMGMKGAVVVADGATENGMDGQ